MQPWCHFLPNWSYLWGMLQAWMRAAPIKLQKKTTVGKGICPLPLVVYIWGNACIRAGICFWRRVAHMGSTQWLEKSSGSSDKVLWAQTKGVNHTVHTKIGISNLEQETATWLRSAITLICSKCENPSGSFNIRQWRFPAIKRTWLFLFVLWLKLWTSALERGILGSLPGSDTELPCD